MQREIQTLRKPTHQAVLFVGPDLDRTIGVGRIKRVGQRGLSRERRRRAVELQDFAAAHPSEPDAE